MANMTTSMLDKYLVKWYKQPENTLDEGCPKRKNKPKVVNSPWWNTTLQKQSRELKTLKRQTEKVSTPATKDSYKRAYKQYRKDCKRVKIDWQEFNTKQNSAEYINKPRKYWKGTN